eukprot:CAMPEP_0204146342 /NCGR_PEP_ID=MMETSP0361-20130328/22086_1 /ASSEMBLY_ACC=CAM_ASM_000343 /TAXON_ID=268821 /ORGANISM="Scrippsiella Hangoei, Strain SHTV-5" /LENGTH=130 /DNA_ID=CAMNT_0051100431 /DNA_START=226 /DNA_END=614 /DNA_ORIENTATION=+
MTSSTLHEGSPYKHCNSCSNEHPVCSSTELSACPATNSKSSATGLHTCGHWRKHCGATRITGWMSTLSTSAHGGASVFMLASGAAKLAASKSMRTTTLTRTTVGNETIACGCSGGPLHERARARTRWEVA